MMTTTVPLLLLLVLLFACGGNNNNNHFVLFVTASGSININNNEFNDQIMPRVLERIDNYIKVPISILYEISKLRDLNAYQYDFTIADHKQMIHELYMGTILKKGWWIALEDGTVFYPYEPPLYNIEIREPGNSGYKVNDVKGNPDHPYNKHLISCVNDTTGESIDCIADVGISYIECVNDCEYILCPSDNNTNDDNSNNITELSKWCQNYIVKEVQPDEEGLLGYMPSTMFCINVYGQPEQRPGYVITNNNGTLGNCYYGDGMTIVNRTLSGQYESCGIKKPCNTAFAGGVTSYEYDARYRSWYIEAKLTQKPSWSEPFIGFNENAIGIQYTIPLYNYQNIQTDIIQTDILNEIANNTINIQKQYKKLFVGLLVGGIGIGNITEFLINTYSNTSMIVMIVEQNKQQNSSNYIIASSTGRSSIKNFLKSDSTKSCPIESSNDPNICTVERLSIQEMKNNMNYSSTTNTNNSINDNDNDIIMYRAFIEHEKLNFPTTRNVNFKVDVNDIQSNAYVAQVQLYNEPNLNWYIFVILPMNRSTNDSITVGESNFILVCILGGIGFISCFILFIQFYYKRTEKAIVNADWRFTCAFILGCSTLNLSTFTLLGYNTNGTCMLRMWSFNILFVCALSPLFVKVWRMAKLLNASTGFKRTNVSNIQAFVYTLPLITIELIILIIFTFIDPPKQTEELGVGIGIGVQQITCQQKTNAFFITQITYSAILIFIGCVLAYITRDLNPRFGEAKQLGFSMYNIAFTGIVVVSVMNFMELDQVSQIILQAVGILWGSFFCSLAFVLPRLLEVNKDRRTRRNSSSSTGSHTGGHNFTGVSGLSQSGVDINDRSSLAYQNMMSIKYDETSNRSDDDTTRGSYTAGVAIIEAMKSIEFRESSKPECYSAATDDAGNDNEKKCISSSNVKQREIDKRNEEEEIPATGVDFKKSKSWNGFDPDIYNEEDISTDPMPSDNILVELCRAIDKITSTKSSSIDGNNDDMVEIVSTKSDEDLDDK